MLKSCTTFLSATLVLASLLQALVSCGPGWDGYDQNYSEIQPIDLTPWSGLETVTVVLDGMEVAVKLEGMQSYDYLGTKAISLSELIIGSGLTQHPDQYRFNFTAGDGYDLLIKRYDDPQLLPSWTDMQQGYLYLDPRYDDLTCGWAEHPWGNALSAYQTKWMNSGIITLIGQ
jgi:hypothetical protein